MNGFRHEIKLLLSPAEAAVLRTKLAALLPLDPNSGEKGEYFIRSLYFDDLSKTSYFEKLAGVSDRKKYRLRVYIMADHRQKTADPRLQPLRLSDKVRMQGKAGRPH